MPRRNPTARIRAPARQGGATAAIAPPGRRIKSQNVVDTLGLKIVSGELQSGALLPTEAELSLRMGLSRPSLREGLRALAHKGLVEARTRRGTKVHDKAHWNVLDADVLRWIAASPPDPAFFMDLLDARNIFEPAAARLAAARATPEQILAIEHAFREMAKALPHDVDGCCRHDLAFHGLIIAATGNRLLVGFAVAIRTALLAAFRLSSNARESYENSLAEHWAVAAAIRRRSPDEADQAMRILLAGTARDLAPAYEKNVRAKSREALSKVSGNKRTPAQKRAERYYKV